MTDLVLTDARCSVGNNGKEIILSPTTFRIFRIIYDARLLTLPERGVTAKHIFYAIYGRHSNGGPMTGPKNIVVMICQMNARLAQIGIGIRSYKGSAGVAYELREIDSEAQWDRAIW